MKDIALICLLLLVQVQVSAASAGNGGVSGGDPIAIKAEKFPDQGKLRSAVESLKSKIATCSLSAQFKSLMTTELERLHREDQFLYVPEVVTLGHSRFAGDYSTLVSSGAFTPVQMGAPIYFSKQVVNYNSEGLAKVIAQELPHHILVGAAATDEALVNSLGLAIVNGKISDELARTVSLALPSEGEVFSCANAAKAKSGNPTAQSSIQRHMLILVKKMIRDFNAQPDQPLTSEHTFRVVMRFPQRIETAFTSGILDVIYQQNRDRTFAHKSVYEKCLKPWGSDSAFDPGQTLRQVSNRLATDTLECVCAH